jgi:glyoxylase-like metal-dependent hydrolase (beta-lactamase superfamily II)
MIGNISCSLLQAGFWKGDGGATMGVLPKVIWQKILPADDKNRIILALNLLLCEVDNKKILIDTGIGNKISDKIRKIYDPSPWNLLNELNEIGVSRFDIDYVILTHLHFDHAGGIVSVWEKGAELTFPNAIHVIQKSEWEIAKKPDKLNSGSYNFQEDLVLLAESNLVQLIDGDFELLPGIKLELTGGHSEGMQIVRLESEGMLAYYAGDIIPLEAHKHLAVNSAFDINRRDSFYAKKRILAELSEKKGVLFLAHDPDKTVIQFQDK